MALGALASHLVFGLASRTGSAPLASFCKKSGGFDVMKAATLGFVTPGMRAEYGLSAAAVAVLFSGLAGGARKPDPRNGDVNFRCANVYSGCIRPQYRQFTCALGSGPGRANRYSPSGLSRPNR